MNSAHGILRNANEPVDTYTLHAFQKAAGWPEAKTGYFCHLRGRFIECDPAKEGQRITPSKQSYEEMITYRLEQIKTWRAKGQLQDALQNPEGLFTWGIEEKLDEIIPEWRNSIALPKAA